MDYRILSQGLDIYNVYDMLCLHEEMIVLCFCSARAHLAVPESSPRLLCCQEYFLGLSSSSCTFLLQTDFVKFGLNFPLK